MRRTENHAANPRAYSGSEGHRRSPSHSQDPGSQESLRLQAAEEQLRRNHETFYDLIQNSPFGVYIVDADFRLVQVSAGAQKVFQHVRPLLGRDFAEILRAIWTEPFASEAIARFRHTLDTGETYRAPDTTQRRNDVDTTESYDWKIERITLPDGRHGVVCYFYDLSERMQLEAALRESEARFRTMGDGIAHMIWVCNPDTRVLFVNQAYRDFFGVSEEALENGDWTPLVHPDDAPAYVGEFLACTRERRPFHAVARVRRGDGEWRWVESYGRPHYSPSGEFLGMVGSSPDVTERRLAEQALARANAELQRFVAIASHDLKEPLRGVGTLASFVLEDEPQLSEASRARLERAKGLCERLTRMIDGLLQYARSGGERRSVPCDLGEIVRRAADQLSETVRLRQVQISIDPGLPTVPGDPVLLERVFANLIANAIKYNNADVKRIEIAADGDRILVRDNGVGIDPRHHDRIFSLFSRLGAAKPTDGIGLGLALVKNIVESHGGSVALESALGQGSTFILRLPTAPLAAPV